MLNTKDLVYHLNYSNTILLDVRSTYEFNGWKIDQRRHGGHIKGAIVFSSTWFDKLTSDKKILSELERYSITKDKIIILYGDDIEIPVYVTGELKKLGYKNVKIYAEGFTSWSNSYPNEIESLPNYKVLAPPFWVKQNLWSNKYKIFEVSFGKGDQYVNCHIPGAAHIDTDDFEEGPLWNKKEDSDILTALLQNGIHKSTKTILYSRDTTAACRVGVILKYAGVEDVYILDGGFQAWLDYGYETESGNIKVTPITDFGRNLPQNPEYIIDMKGAKEVLSDKNGRLISVCSWDEYIGQTSGYRYIRKAGRIKGAVFGYSGLNPWDMSDYRSPNNTMINYKFIRDRWAKNSITQNTNNSFYCGTGWRASETWFYALALGWKTISIYDGGWKEWSEVKNNSIITGDI